MKFQVWSESKQRWRTAYCLPELLHANIDILGSYGYRLRTRLPMGPFMSFYGSGG